MKVLTAELIESNKRERISGGVYVEFESSENIKKGCYVKVKVDGINYSFEVNGIKVNGEKLKISAKEVGYWAHTLEQKGIDLRTIIGCEVSIVTDETESKKIYERSCWL